jgi:hypothetical protein
MKELEKLIMALYKKKERDPGTHWIGGWACPRTRPDVVEK